MKNMSVEPLNDDDEGAKPGILPGNGAGPEPVPDIPITTALKMIINYYKVYIAKCKF